MTHEEAKKIGATHYWDYPASGLPIDYYKKDGDNICVWADWLEKPDWLPNEKLKGYKFKPL